MNKVSTPTRTNELLKKYDIKLKKSLGQNFLVDPNILRNIVAAADLDASKGALEIGPGIGALTQHLAESAARVVAVEIDRRLFPVLEETLAAYPHVQLIHGDILKIDLEELFQEYFQEVSQVSVVANLPYYVTTPIVMKLLEARLPLEHIVVMVQKEVAERMGAAPGTKQYGSLSVAVQYYCEPKVVAIVPGSVFIPKPDVDSAVIRLTVRSKPPVEVKDELFFFEVMQACFVQRRKTLWNNMLSKFGKEKKDQLTRALNRCSIDPARRGETLSIAEFAQLAEMIQEELSGFS
ncbi:MAG: 16S rRNA (adenine(1518)-N(6)/adenine(1519)-N(6))-dimethyltransferase RsmA [Paenibacillaceae bacterium]